MKKLISIVFLLIGFTLNAQTISGVVYDVENANEPLPFADVYIKNGTKVTCKLSDIQINNINQEIIDLINIGFNVENQENE